MAEKNRPVERCPFCDYWDLKKFDELRDRNRAGCLTEKEIADYTAGEWGTEIRSNCGLAMDCHQDLQVFGAPALPPAAGSCRAGSTCAGIPRKN